MTNSLQKLLLLFLSVALPGIALASGGDGSRLDLTHHWAGYTAIAIFVVAYGLVMAEEFTHLRKSKPVILAAGIIWAIIAMVYQSHPELGVHVTDQAVRHNLLEYA